MPIEIDCENCGREYRVSDDKVGRQFRCKDCGETVNIPDDWDDEFSESEWEEDQAWSSKPNSKRSKRQDAKARLMIPAIALMVIGAVTFLLVLAVCIRTVLTGPDPAEIPPPGPARDGYMIGFYTGSIAISAVFVTLHILVILGANHMRTLESRSMAKTSAIISCIPLCICLCFGMPFGIWALIVMRDKSVSSSFRS